MISGTLFVLLVAAGTAWSLEQAVRNLDDPRFQVRESAERALLEAGREALPPLLALPAPTAEVRFRRQRIVRRIQHQDLVSGFARLTLAPVDSATDVEMGLFLISRLGDPLLEQATLNAQLDSLAERVRKRLGGDTVPKLADPQAIIAAVRHVLFTEDQFTATLSNDPQDAYLDQVLARRRGLPIVVSHIVVAIGRRLEVPLVGLAVPSRYMVKYDGRHAPAGYPRDDLILDCLEGGRLLTAAELQSFVEQMGWDFDPVEHGEACPARTALRRMLHNLLPRLRYLGHWQAVRTVNECLALVDDEDAGG